MKKLLALFLLIPWAVGAAERIVATITVTNQPALAETLTINGSVRYWSATAGATNILRGTNYLYSSTNLWLHLGGNPAVGTSVSLTDSNEVTVYGIPGLTLAVSSASTWATITLSTNAVTNAVVVRVPMSVESEAVRTNNASQLARDLEAYSPTPFATNSTLLSQYADTINAQAIGPKTIDGGIVTNATGIHGTIRTLTGGTISGGTTVTGATYYGTIGLLSSGTVSGSTVTNGTFYGTIGALSGGTVSGSVVTNATYYGTPGLLDGGGTGVLTNNEYSGTIGELDGGEIANTTLVSPEIQNGFGNAATITNLTSELIDAIDTYSQLLRLRMNAHSTLVNGDNSGMVITNTFTKVTSGPSAAFTIHGINNDGTADGTLVILWNSTGQDMTIAHQSGTEATATYRIITNTGANVSTTGDGVAALIYDNGTGRWRLLWSSP